MFYNNFKMLFKYVGNKKISCFSNLRIKVKIEKKVVKIGMT